MDVTENNNNENTVYMKNTKVTTKVTVTVTVEEMWSNFCAWMGVMGLTEDTRTLTDKVRQIHESMWGSTDDGITELFRCGDGHLVLGHKNLDILIDDVPYDGTVIMKIKVKIGHRTITVEHGDIRL